MQFSSPSKFWTAKVKNSQICPGWYQIYSIWGLGEKLLTATKILFFFIIEHFQFRMLEFKKNPPGNIKMSASG